MAGIIGAMTNNSSGIAGINWGAKILPVRVLGKCGGTDSDIIDGMRWAAGLPVPGVPTNPNPARVMNLSLSGSATTCPTTYQAAINDVVAKGALIVVAAGNNAVNVAAAKPANCPGVITVAATNLYGDITSYSNYGNGIDISAPGGDAYGAIYSTVNSGTQGPLYSDYGYIAGTSQAAPHVAATAALMLSANPSLTVQQLATQLHCCPVK